MFGAVQLGMVAYGVMKGERLSMRRTGGLILALLGMAAQLLPGATAPPLGSAVIMVCAGFAWAAYTLTGKRVSDPALVTARNFLVAVPLALTVSPLISRGVQFDATGVILAVLSGSAASAGAYVLWYSILPHVDSVTASTVQLSVPCLAILGGVLFLGEAPSLRMILSTVTVLFGIAMVLGISRRRKNS